MRQCLTIAFAISAGSLAANADDQPPNVMFILTEDQGAHLSFVGTPGLRTPHMDSLARSGVYFRNAFVAYPVCSASKAALYTGLHSHTNGILNNTHNFHMPAEQVSTAQRSLKLAQTNRVRDQFQTLTEILHRNGYYQGVTHKLHVLPNRKFPYDEFLRGRPHEIEQFITTAGKRNQPWFLMVNIPNSHRPYPNSDRQPIRVDPAKVDLPNYLPDSPEVRKDWAEYLAGIEEADKLTGEAVELLKKSGQQENTVVVFMSDHGPTFQHGKMTLYDLGLRVPLVISGPRVTSPKTCDELVSELDLLPTILELCGINASFDYTLHGESLVSLLSNSESTVEREYVFAEISNRGPLPNDGMQERSVMDGRWKLIYRENVATAWRQVNADSREKKIWGNRTYDETVRLREQFPDQFRILSEMDPQNLGGRVPEFELYDLLTDRDEMHNLANVASHRKHRERLFGALLTWMKVTQDSAMTHSRDTQDSVTEVHDVTIRDDSIEIRMPNLQHDIRLVTAGVFSATSNVGETVYEGPCHGQLITVDRQSRLGRDRLFDRFVVVSKENEALGSGKYATELADLPAPGVTPNWPTGIKGLQDVQDFADASDLGVAHVTQNVLITSLLKPPSDQQRGSEEMRFHVDGQPYDFDESYVRRLDRKILEATRQGMNTIAILLCTTRGRSNLLVHPNADTLNAPSNVMAVNTTEREAEQRYRAVIGFLGRRYSRPDKLYGHIGGYIVGNEVQSHWYWHNMGRKPTPAVIRQYATQLRTTYYALRKQVVNPGVFASFDHYWTARHGNDPQKAIPGKEFLTRLNEEISSGGDFPWHVAWHPYPENLFDPAFWEDTQATYSFDTPKMTFRNIELLPAWLQQKDFLYKGKPRRVILSEQGFHARRDKDGELLQAAAYAASYVRVRAIDGIDAYILHRHVDHPREGGLNLGLRRHGRNPLGAKRLIHDVFRAAGTEKQADAFRFALPIVGLDSWSEMLPRSGPFPHQASSPPAVEAP